MKRGSRKNRVLDYYLGIPLLQLAALGHRRRSFPKHIERVGILVNPALGDTLLSSGPVKDLRAAFPAQRLIFFCAPSNRISAELLPGLDEQIVISFTRPHEAIAQLRAAKLDILFDFTSWQRITAFCSLMSGARYVIGFQSPGQYRDCGYDAVALHRRDVHEIENMRALVRAAGIHAGLAPELQLPESQAPARTSGGQERIVFHAWPSGARSWLREWPMANWVELARGMNRPEYHFVLTGSPQDRPRSEELRAALQAEGISAEVFTGSDGLISVAHLLQQARLLVSVNTGIMHLGAILGTPTVVINGPTAEHRWGPVGPRVANVNAPDGRGGFLHLGFEFDGNPTDSMERTPVNDVLAAAEQFLNKY